MKQSGELKWLNWNESLIHNRIHFRSLEFIEKKRFILSNLYCSDWLCLFHPKFNVFYMQDLRNCSFFFTSVDFSNRFSLRAIQHTIFYNSTIHLINCLSTTIDLKCMWKFHSEYFCRIDAEWEKGDSEKTDSWKRVRIAIPK